MPYIKSGTLSWGGVQWGRERQLEKFTNLLLIFDIFPFLFNSDFFPKI
jgi:hypothetical protein